jgi:hypothetical protein
MHYSAKSLTLIALQVTLAVNGLGTSPASARVARKSPSESLATVAQSDAQSAVDSKQGQPDAEPPLRGFDAQTPVNQAAPQLRGLDNAASNSGAASATSATKASPLQTSGQASAAGSIPLKEVTITKSSTKTDVFKNKFIGEYLAIKVHLRNSSSTPYVLAGDKADVEYPNGTHRTPASEDQAINAIKGPMTRKEQIIVGVIAVGTLGMAGPIAAEILEGGSKNPLVRYGAWQIRRDLEAQRLGYRIMLPAEETDGTVFLRASFGTPSRITIPVYTYPEQKAVGKLIVELTR